MSKWDLGSLNGSGPPCFILIEQTICERMKIPIKELSNIPSVLPPCLTKAEVVLGGTISKLSMGIFRLVQCILCNKLVRRGKGWMLLRSTAPVSLPKNLTKFSSSERTASWLTLTWAGCRKLMCINVCFLTLHQKHCQRQHKGKADQPVTFRTTKC